MRNPARPNRDAAKFRLSLLPQDPRSGHARCMGLSVAHQRAGIIAAVVRVRDGRRIVRRNHIRIEIHQPLA